jgi:hypothetical protein
MPQEIKEQEITHEEQQLADNPHVEEGLGEDADAIPADQLPQERTDPLPLDDSGGFEAVEHLELNEPASGTGEEV